VTATLRSELSTALSGLYPGARAETLVADASTRRFHRLFLEGGATRVVMDYGSPFDDETDDVRLARLFERAALPVAQVFDVLPAAGALVLEDLGDVTLEVALSADAPGAPPARGDLYDAAVRLAASIATRGSAVLAESDRSAGPALDAERFLFEMNFFLEHYVGGFLGRPEAANALRAGVESLALEVAAHPRVLCHRDYHSRNIMVRATGKLALVDIQDARWGPDTYDLASLLRDAYVDLGELEVDRLVHLYGSALRSPLSDSGLRNRFDIVAAQRMIKALGTFGYQIAVLGRQRYKSAVPRTLERLSRLLPANTQTARLAEAMIEAGVLSR
jgi:N-acetylmuramate 1-kinase